MGKTIQEDILDSGPSHMQGDISKCPYYAAKTGKPNRTACLTKYFGNKGLTDVMTC